MSKGPGYVEYRLKVSAAAVVDLQHHVLILNSTSMGLSDLTPPLRLHRQGTAKSSSDNKDDDIDDEDNGDGEDDLIPGHRQGRQFRRKTRILNVERIKEAERAASEAQSFVPWILEDADAQHTFTGRLEGGQERNYVFFVNQGRDFMVVPAAKWYRFNPKPAYRPLTSEEAEAQMAARGRNRVVMAAQLQQSREKEARAKSTVSSAAEMLTLQDIDEEESPLAANGVGRLADLRSSLMREAEVAASVGQFAATSGRSRLSPVNPAAMLAPEHGDELDYDEVFDDDDQGEAADPDEDDPSAPRPVVRMISRQTKLSAAGRDLGKLVRHLDRKVVDYGLSDDDDRRDPYADPDDFNDDDDGNVSDASSARSSQSSSLPPARKGPILATTPRQPPMEALPPHLGPGASVFFAENGGMSRPASLPSLTGPRSGPQGQSGTASVAVTRASQQQSGLTKRKAEAMAPSKPSPTVAAKAPVSAPVASVSGISQNDIIQQLRRGPTKTKDLIAALRDRLKDQPSKDAFKDIIKRVATVRAGASEDEKWLELRPEFK